MIRSLPVAVALVGLACRDAAPNRDAPAARPPAVAVDTNPPARPTRIDGITIDPHPRCGPALDEPTDASQEAWRKAPEAERNLHALNTALHDLEHALVGIALDHERRAAIVVFHTDFEDYESVRQRLVGRIAPLEVVLQPSCYARAKLADVEQLLLQGSWHPKAKDTRRGFWLDASFSGYRVTVDDSAPEVADALKQALGEQVRVSLGKPGRH
jgi:hypothetical protein